MKKDWFQIGGIVGGGFVVGATALYSWVFPLITMIGGAVIVAVLEVRKPRD